MNTVTYGIMYLRSSILTLFLHQTDLCLNLGIGVNEHPTGKVELTFLFFHLDHWKGSS